ncbi:MAG TPA: primosomal protein N' [Chloroflexota bacterium]
MFTYGVPSSTPVSVGSLVWVSLGSRQLPGLVVRVSAQPPPFDTKPILSLLYPDPLLGPVEIDLARWISTTYWCPLFDALAAMLPPGLLRRVRLDASLVDVPPSLDAHERFVVERLRRATRPVPVDGLRRQLGAEGTAALERLARRGTVALHPRLSLPRALCGGRPGEERARLGEPLPLPPLSPDQDDALRPILDALERGVSETFLLHGVTGSGKTHVYLAAIAATLARQRQALVLVSEIALTPEAVQRFSRYFPGRVAVLHSELPAGRHVAEWWRVRRGEAGVVIGSRSAVFAPLPRLGLIVVDEEHEWSYKQDQTPRYHARDVAIQRARLTGAVAVLGSATPDVVSYHRACQGVYRLLQLPRRYRPPRAGALPTASAGLGGGEDGAAGEVDAVLRTSLPRLEREGESLPPVEVVDLRAELRDGNVGLFSRRLVQALDDALARGEQAVLFLNRRGSATCVTCRDCGHVVTCARCSFPLVYHQTGEALLCHHCNRRREPPQRCPACAGRRIRYLGVGTQRVEEEVRRRFPGARVLRWDRDVATGHRAHEALWSAFESGEADVLVGTQMVAKALDVPRVTLVGVVLADVGLHLPDFRAAERTFQLLTQVAGRAGRGERPGRAIIQTYTPDHYAIRTAQQHDYPSFYEREVRFRRQQGYPPFCRLARLVYAATNEQQCWRETQRVTRRLRDIVRSLGIGGIDVLGPVPCFHRRLRGRFRWQVVLRGDDFAPLLRRLALPRGWVVDVDPVSTL